MNLLKSFSLFREGEEKNQQKYMSVKLNVTRKSRYSMKQTTNILCDALKKTKTQKSK